MAMKIVTIHVLIYILPLLRLQYYFALPASLSELSYQPWTLLTYSFFHADFIHLLFNSLFLTLTGRLFFTFFTGETFLRFYFWGALGAASVYLIGVHIWGQTSGFLYGSSAATMAVFFAIVAYQPNMSFPLPFIGHVLLKYIALFLLATDALSLLDTSNVGGHLSHLGGAAVGFLYMKQFEMGRDVLNPCYWRKKRKEKKRKSSTSNATAHNQKMINKILEKLSRSGYESLSNKEKELLFHAGKSKPKNQPPGPNVYNL